MSRLQKDLWLVLFGLCWSVLFLGGLTWMSKTLTAPGPQRYFCFTPDPFQADVDSMFRPTAFRGLVRDKVYLPYVRGSRVPEAFFLRLVRLEDSTWRIGGAVNRRFDFSDDADMRIYVSQEIYDQVAVGDTFRKLAGDYTYLLLSQGGDSLLAEPRFHYQCQCRQRNYSHDRKDGKLCCWGRP